ncbi:MAG: chlorite dismutase family protein [Rhodocyclaceae bacterium]
MNPRLFSFLGKQNGPWRVQRIVPVTGESLPDVSHIELVAGSPDVPSVWALRGVTSNERYVERSEKTQLLAVQQGLGRPEASCAALIPIRKNAGWWALTQDERRHIFEAQSHHNAIGMDYLPPIARRLHHCRDLPEDSPFDFLTWFEFAPEHATAFDNLLARLRATPEWGYVEREVEIRLERA